MTVTVVGAGFAGLTLAHELVKSGFAVEVHEKRSRPGGLIETVHGAHGLIETAANALIADRAIEDLFDGLKLSFAPRLASRKRRYVFWQKPRRWPLSVGATLRLLAQAVRLTRGNHRLRPQEGESVRAWARRFAGRQFEERLLSPALQGVYAGDPEELSATLILRQMMSGRPERGLFKGSVAPVGGMGALIAALADAVQAGGGRVHYGSDYALSSMPETPTVICTSAWEAAGLLRAPDAEAAAVLARCQSLPLLTATCFFEPSPSDINGFGCLFPLAQGFSALGVVCNDRVFKGRSDLRSETWILGGAPHPELLEHPDDEILDMILADRRRLCGASERPREWRLTRHPRALPHYTTTWERDLKALAVAPPLYLHGNYLGALGLARIYARSRELARRIGEAHGGG